MSWNDSNAEGYHLNFDKTLLYIHDILLAWTRMRLSQGTLLIRTSGKTSKHTQKTWWLKRGILWTVPETMRASLGPTVWMFPMFGRQPLWFESHRKFSTLYTFNLLLSSRSTGDWHENRWAATLSISEKRKTAGVASGFPVLSGESSDDFFEGQRAGNQNEFG